MKKLLLPFLFVIIPFTGLFAQYDFTSEEEDKWDEANELFEITDYFNAWNLYMELRNDHQEFAELNYKIGVCIFKLKGDLYEALRYLEEAGQGDFPEAYYYMGRSYHQLEKFQLAEKYYNWYKEYNHSGLISEEELSRQLEITLRAKEMLKNKSGLEITNVGSEVNTEYSDYVPLVTSNDSMMIFTSRRKGSTGGEKDPYDNYFEDMYYSFKKDGAWTHAENMGKALNTATHDACVGLSPDGKTLILFRTNEQLTGGDLYMSNFKAGKWTKPEKLSENINSEYQEASASLSADGNILYFSSNRPGGLGGKDIYRSVRFGNGDWSLPVNLGEPINTKYDDDAPFISIDDNTLYFSSNGHQTIGGYDVFKSERDEEGKWQDPLNMGAPINSVEDDIYFVITGGDEIAYYSSGKPGGLGGQDIYQINMIDKNEFVTIVKGFIKDTDGNPVKGKIVVKDEESGKTQGIYRSNAKTGKYLMVVQPKVKYEITVSAKKHEDITEPLHFDFEDNFVEVSKQYKLMKK